MKTRMDHKKEEPSRHLVGRGSAQQTASGDGEMLQRIAVCAYELYRERGAIDGHDVEDWLEAEQAILGQEATHESVLRSVL